MSDQNKMSKEDIEKLFDEAKCSSQHQGCDHNCATCGINKSQPGLWKVYLGLAAGIIIVAIAASYASDFFATILR